MIGKLIYTLLSENTDVTDLIPAARIFPYVMEENTPLPSMVYTINGVTPEYTKDGLSLDMVAFSTILFSKTYAELQTIMKAVRASLELQRVNTENDITNRIYLVSSEEGYNLTEDVYMARLTFETETLY